MTDKSRDLSIDLVKVVAMMCVMILHIPAMWRTDSNLLAFTMSRAAGMAIPLFFMVSGYLLFGRKPDFRYSLKKIWGILRFVLILSLSWTFLFMLLKHQFDVHEFIYAIFAPFIQEGMFGVFWYLGAMCIIYACLPLINGILLHYPPPFVKTSVNQNLTRLLAVLTVLIVVSSVIFQANIIYGVERKIFQMFRVWNWFLYFFFGALMKELNLTNISLSGTIRALCIAVAVCLYIIFQKISVPIHLGIEYFFGSPAHITFSILMFIAIASVKIQSRKVISWLSNLFLPVYAFHSLVIYFLGKLNLLGVNYVGFITPLINFLLVSSITIGVSAIVMKLPVIKNVFKI